MIHNVAAVIVSNACVRYLSSASTVSNGGHRGGDGGCSVAAASRFLRCGSTAIQQPRVLPPTPVTPQLSYHCHHLHHHAQPSSQTQQWHSGSSVSLITNTLHNKATRPPVLLISAKFSHTRSCVDFPRDAPTAEAASSAYWSRRREPGWQRPLFLMGEHALVTTTVFPSASLTSPTRRTVWGAIRAFFRRKE